MQVYFFPETIVVAVNFVHLSPDLTAADAGEEGKRINSRHKARALALKLLKFLKIECIS
jgi:hypothetical protein